MNILHRAVFLFLIAALAPAGGALAHGVRTEVAVGAMTVVSFTHEDGSPMAATPFTVLAPGHTQPFLTGTTDRHGRVVFLPDEAGPWKVRVASADGHGAVVTIDVDSTAVGMTSQEPAAVYAHDHEAVDFDMSKGQPGPGLDVAADHDHAHAHGDGHGDAPAGTRPAGSGGDRGFDAAVGLAVLVAVLAVAAFMVRRRRG